MGWYGYRDRGVMMDEEPANANGVERLTSLKTITMVVYALQGASFFFGITAIVAIIINYVKKEDVRGTWLESHFQWQVRTFWFSLLWGGFGLITFLLVVGYFILIADGIWVIYRVVKGGLNLIDGKEMYAMAASVQARSRSELP